ncbi:hypothetical protein GCM10009069_06110 [Algimonas arctica]|uniref:Uncharacterized protein n=1 Tax=Algimonas arctica TaxID=1479486 RepID=A0A8J3G1F5_9PROT|nr:hypothetical protein [Algimonas arctica]GHA85675.1 hypothetical protein GCM10009069_06110 [Algimonas arctica]
MAVIAEPVSTRPDDNWNPVTRIPGTEENEYVDTIIVSNGQPYYREFRVIDDLDSGYRGRIINAVIKTEFEYKLLTDVDRVLLFLKRGGDSFSQVEEYEVFPTKRRGWAICTGTQPELILETVTSQPIMFVDSPAIEQDRESTLCTYGVPIETIIEIQTSYFNERHVD